MKPFHKAVLRSQTMALVKGMTLSSKIFAELYQRHVIDAAHIEQIEAHKTNTDRVYTLLQILPKQGSDAFDIFVSILEKDYPLIAEKLKEGCEKLSKEFPQSDATNGNNVPRGELVEVERHLESRGFFHRTKIDIPSLEDVYKLAAFKVQTLMGRKANLRPRQQQALTQWLTHQIYQVHAIEASRAKAPLAEVPAHNGPAWTLPCRKCRAQESILQQKLFGVYLKAAYKLTGEVEVRDEDSQFKPGLLLSDMNLKVMEAMVVHLLDVVDVTTEKLEGCLDYFRDRHKSIANLPLEDMVKMAKREQEKIEAENRRLKAQVEALTKKEDGGPSQEEWQRKVEDLHSRLAETTIGKAHLRQELERLVKENSALASQTVALQETRQQAQDKQHTIEKLRARVALLEVELRGRRRSFQLGGGPMTASEHTYPDQPHPPPDGAAAGARERRPLTSPFVPKRRRVKKAPKKKKGSSH